MNLDPKAAAAAITERTRAILPVHLFGQSAELTPLLELAQKHQLRLIGDCAQAFGARYQGKSVGALGDAGCFSFFPTKNLGGYGDGGLITTDCDKLADAVRVLRNHGSRQQYYHDEVGYNSRLDEVQAAAYASNSVIWTNLTSRAAPSQRFTIKSCPNSEFERQKYWKTATTCTVSTRFWSMSGTTSAPPCSSGALVALSIILCRCIG